MEKIEPLRPYRAARRSLQRRDRAAAHRPVVCRCGDPGQAGDRGGEARPHHFRAEELGDHLFPLDGEHPALVHLAPAVVGPSDPGLVRARRQDLRRRGRGGGARRSQDALRQGGCAEARRGRARHLVLLRAVAVLDARLARPDARARPLLPDRRAGHRLRHHLLLGRAHDDDGPPCDGGGAVPRRLHPRAGPRREGPEDVEVEGQRHRPARPDRDLRRRCAAIHAGRHGGARPRHQAQPLTRGGLSQLRHQAVERRALRRDQ